MARRRQKTKASTSVDIYTSSFSSSSLKQTHDKNPLRKRSDSVELHKSILVKMSHFIASSLLSRTSATVTSVSNTMVSSFMPALPKLGYSCQVRNLHMLTNSYRSTKQQQHMERIQNNMARVYARRVLELAAMSAATLASTTALEAAIEKPPEWSTIDLAEERRKFGENFSTLGKSAISRVWAAGEMNGILYIFV